MKVAFKNYSDFVAWAANTSAYLYTADGSGNVTALLTPQAGLQSLLTFSTKPTVSQLPSNAIQVDNIQE